MRGREAKRRRKATLSQTWASKDGAEPKPYAQPLADGCRLLVTVRPRSRLTRVAGILGGRVKVELVAPPVDGKANAALLAYLATVLGVPKSHMSIVRGERGKEKTVRVVGRTAKEARLSLAEHV